MKKNWIYLDNAATTQIDRSVVIAMEEVVKNIYGNPSSTHRYGSMAKSIVEKNRNLLGHHLGGGQGHFFFTSGGTEANNWMIQSWVLAQKKRAVILASPLEHSSLLTPLKNLVARGWVDWEVLPLKDKGGLDEKKLADLLKKHKRKPCLVSVMHSNNEIGNLNNLKQIGALCQEEGAHFHSDLVQGIGYYPLNLASLGLDFATGSAHKFHGPKGIGFLYVRSGRSLLPLIQGGSQERGMRGGTENLIGISGLGKAVQVAYSELPTTRPHITQLKGYLIKKLKELPISFRGASEDLGKSHYKIISLALPSQLATETLLLQLELEGILASSGSACMSHSIKNSHVIEALYPKDKSPTLRIGLSKYSNKEMVDHLFQVLKKLCL